MPNTSLREAAPTAALSTSAQCPMPNAQCPMPHTQCPVFLKKLLA
ncbi:MULTISPECIES: hypothetical protein [Nostoc]|nr:MULTISPECIES: hypothetical protein [Nostoc]